jgi:glutathione S-transferase
LKQNYILILNLLNQTIIMSDMKLGMAAIAGIGFGALITGALVRAGAPKRETKNATQAPPTLNYWNGRGLMEVPRMCFVVNGSFPGKGFVDNKTNSPSGDLASNLGRMPNIETSEGGIGQGMACNFYAASVNNLMGDSLFQSAKVMEMLGHISELKDVWYKIVPYGSEPSQEDLDKFFDSGGSDTEGVAQSRGERFLTWYLGRINAAITGTNGFAVGNRLSLADLVLYNVFAEFLTKEENADRPDFKRHQFADAARTAALVSKYPKIQSSIDQVKANANIQKWIATRGPQNF